jgi:hypothetical protein
VFASNPATQAVAGRQPQEGLSANGLPIATFDGGDTLGWPLAANNNGTTYWGVGFWMRPAAVAGTKFLASISDGSGGASAKKIIFYQDNANIFLGAYSSGSDGRQGQKNTVFAVGTWVFVRASWSSARTGDDRIRIYVNGVLQTLTFSNLGAGGLPTDLKSGVTGNLIFGAFNDAATTNPFSGTFGPNIYTFSTDPTAAEETALMNFEAPT